MYYAFAVEEGVVFCRWQIKYNFVVQFIVNFTKYGSRTYRQLHVSYGVLVYIYVNLYAM